MRHSPLLDRSVPAIRASKAESGARWTGAALYLPSHSLIFSSTNSSPFARSWFCRKRTKDTRVGLLHRVTNPDPLPVGEGTGFQALGRCSSLQAEKAFYPLGRPRLPEASVRQPKAKEGDESQTQVPSPSLRPGNGLPQAWLNSLEGLGQTPNVLQALRVKLRKGSTEAMGNHAEIMDLFYKNDFL